MLPILQKILRRLTESSPFPKGAFVSFSEANELVHLPDSATMDLLAAAGIVRAVCSPPFFNCAIVNAKSGHCPEDCAFCAQSLHHSANAPVYPLMKQEDLLYRAVAAKAAGASHFGIVTSGTRLSERDADSLCQTIERIIKETELSVCGSLGMVNYNLALQLKQAGMSRYHHNLETAPSFFTHICTTHDYEDDIASIRAAQKAGLEICSGGIAGLGESPEQRAEWACLLAELNVDSIPLNFLIPIKGTKLSKQPPLPVREALRTIALFRIVHPKRQLLIAGGRSHVLGEWESWLYAAGANGMMIGDYLTAPGAQGKHDQMMMKTLGVR